MLRQLFTLLSVDLLPLAVEPAVACWKFLDHCSTEIGYTEYVSWVIRDLVRPANKQMHLY